MDAGFGRFPDELCCKPRISATEFRVLLKSPRHLKNRPEFKETPAMRFGTGFHRALLEPDRYELENPEMPEFNKRTKQGKADYEQFMNYHPDHLGFDEDDRDRIKNMLTACKEHPYIPKLLKDASIEEQFWWDKGDVLYTGRPDAVIKQRRAVIDVKTTGFDADPDTWNRTVHNDKLMLQAAMYLDAMTRIYGDSFETFIWIVVETKPPYTAMCYFADFGVLEVGRAMIKNLTKLFLDCWNADRWPGYNEGLVPATLPTYAWNQYETYTHEEIVR